MNEVIQLWPLFRDLGSLGLLVALVVVYLPKLVKELESINAKIGKLETVASSRGSAGLFPLAMLALALLVVPLAGCRTVSSTNDTAKAVICRTGDAACEVGQFVCDITHAICGDPAMPKPPPTAHVDVTVRVQGADGGTPLVSTQGRPARPLAYTTTAVQGEPPPPPPPPCGCGNPCCPPQFPPQP